MIRRSASLAAFLLLVAAGCSAPQTPPSSASSTHTPAAGDPVVVAALDLGRGFDPWASTDPHVLRIASLLQRGLYRYDAKGKPVAEVAESIESTDDRHYTVTLAPGWRFSNGEPVSAASFVDAWSRAADPALGFVQRDLFAPIEGFVAVPGSRPSGTRSAASPSPGAASTRPTGRSPQLSGLRVLDARTFTITLSRPQPDFEQRLGHVAFAPRPDVAFTDPEEFTRSPVGNGPYRLDGTWQPSGVDLRPDATYTGQDPAKNPGLRFRRYTDPQAAWNDLAAGRLDVLDVVPTARLSTYREEFAQRAVNQPAGATLDLVVPASSPDWGGPANAARRRAVSMSVDREALARDVLGGTAAPAADLATPVVEGHSQDLCGPACRRDPAEARRLLGSAGRPPSRIDVAYAADLDQQAVAQALCADLGDALALPCSARRYATVADLRSAVASGRQTGPYLERYQMSYPLLENFLLPRFVAGARQNTSGYDDPATDATLSRAVVREEDRVARYHDAEERILADMPIVPLVDLNAAAISSAAIDPVQLDVFGSPTYTLVERP